MSDDLSAQRTLSRGATHSREDEERSIGGDGEQHAHSPSEKGSKRGETLAVLASAEIRGFKRFWDRLRGKGRRQVGVLESLKNILLSSCALVSTWSTRISCLQDLEHLGLNILLLLIPIAWASHFIAVNNHDHSWGKPTPFVSHSH